MRNTVRRLSAGAGAFALALAGVALTGGAASADAGPDQVDIDTTGSLNIHKRVGVAEGEAGTGELIANPGGTGLADVTFTLWQLGKSTIDGCLALDLRDTDAWESIPSEVAPATTAGVLTDGFCFVDPVNSGRTGTTDAQGEYTFTGLDLGLYYVQETDAPEDIVATSAPFYVSIPTKVDSAVTNHEWLYDVHVYPKNQRQAVPTKVINTDPEQGSFVLGSTVEWTITQTVPRLNANQTFDIAEIWDVLPASLEYDDTTSVKLAGVDLDPSDYTIDEDGVTWTLTTTGRAKLPANVGETIEIVFTTKVIEVTASGAIDNPGSTGTDPGYGSKFNEITTPGEDVPYTYWGQLDVTKTAPDGKVLKDAEFKVFPAGADDVCAPEVPTTGLVSTGISGTDGVVTWTQNVSDEMTSPLGLWIANSVKDQLTNPSKVYCLYETKVPAGYVGQVGARAVTITPGSDNILAVSVENLPRETPELPLTGAQGTMMLTLGGLALVGLGAGTLYMTRGRRNESA